MDLLISEIREQVNASKILFTLSEQNLLLCKELLQQIEELVYSEEGPQVYKDRRKLVKMILEIQNYLRVIQEVTGSARFGCSDASTKNEKDMGENRKRKWDSIDSSSSHIDIKPDVKKLESRKRLRKNAKNSEISSTKKQAPEQVLLDVIDEVDDSRLNLELEKINKVCRLDGKLLFLIKWKELEEPAFVHFSVARENYPLDLIHFFQGVATWKDGKGILEKSVDLVNNLEELEAFKDGIQRLQQEKNDKTPPEKIIGATNIYGELSFLVLWINVDEEKEAHLVPARIMNQKYPELVLDFYEKSTMD